MKKVKKKIKQISELYFLIINFYVKYIVLSKENKIKESLKYSRKVALNFT